MSAPLNWLREVWVCRAIYCGILETAGCGHEHAIAAANEEVYFGAAMFLAQRIARPETRGGQKALAACLAELKAHCVHEAMRRLPPGTPEPTAEQIAEYEQAGRADSDRAERYISECLARRAQEAAA